MNALDFLGLRARVGCLALTRSAADNDLDFQIHRSSRYHEKFRSYYEGCTMVRPSPRLCRQQVPSSSAWCSKPKKARIRHGLWKRFTYLAADVILRGPNIENIRWARLNCFGSKAMSRPSTASRYSGEKRRSPSPWVRGGGHRAFIVSTALPGVFWYVRLESNRALEIRAGDRQESKDSSAR